LAQVPDEQILAGLHHQSQMLQNSQGNNAGQITPESSISVNEEITLENLLEDDPLLSFTTALDRQRSNDTIIEVSSPITNESDEFVIPMDKLKNLTLHANDSTSSVLQQLHPVQLSQTVSNSPSVNHPAIFMDANNSVPNLSRNNYSIGQDQAGPIAPMFMPEFEQEPIVPPSGNMKAPIPMNGELNTQQIQAAAQLRMQFQNNAMVHNQQQKPQPISTHAPQHPISHSIPPQANLIPIAPRVPSMQQVPVQQHMYHRVMSHPPHPQPMAFQQAMFPMQEGGLMIDAPQTIQTSPALHEHVVAKTPRKPPIVKSHSTTKLQKTKKSSISGASKAPLKLIKSKSFLNSGSITKKIPMYQTLDFSRTIVMQAPDNPKIGPGLKAHGMIKNYEFVYEPGDGKISSPRRASASSTPTVNKFTFAKPPTIDGTVSNYSPSPTTSDTSGHSPLTFSSQSQQSPAVSSLSKFGSDRVSPKGGEHTITLNNPPRMNRQSPNTSSPPFVMKDMKSGMLRIKTTK
jgi:hypothetical protein